MVTEYRMSDRLAPVQYQGNHQLYVGRDYVQTKPYSEQVAFEIDQEVRQFLMEAHAKAHEIIEAHRAQHKLIAEKLLELETFDAK
ncbi:cell division protein FtsH, partial [Enterococcus lactis]